MIADAEAQLRSFLQEYTDAFNRFDAEAIASFYDVPCLMVGPAETVVFTRASDFTDSMRALVAHHRVQRFGSARIADLRVTLQADELALATVNWDVIDVDGAPLWTFGNTYQLVRRQGAWRIASSTTHSVS